MSNEPKYRHIYELLRERVLRMEPGERLESVRALRESCGVSLATVNSALWLLAEEGLIESVRKRGIFRAGGSGEAVRRPVILILPGRDEPLFRRIIFSCYEALEAGKMRLQLMIHKLTPRDELETVSRAFKEKPAGILYMPTQVSARLKQVLREECGHIPLVQLNRETGAAEVSFVGTRCYEASLKATERLIECGHRRIGLIKPKDSGIFLDQQERIAGFLAALKRHGIPHRSAFDVCFDPADRRLASDVIELLSGRERPTAFFATNSAYLPEFFRKAGFCNLKIPDDLSVSCVDIADTFRELPLSVDRYEQPLPEICGRAVEILHEMIVSHDFRPRRELLNAVPCIGDSCGSPPNRADMPSFKEKESFYIPKQLKGNENVSRKTPSEELEKYQLHSY